MARGKERKYNLLDSDGTEQEGGRGLQGFFRLICCVGVFVLFLLVGIGVGVMIGYFVFGGAKTNNCSPQKPSPNTKSSKTVLFEWGAVVNDKGNLVSALDKGADQMEATNMENNLK